MKPLRDSGQPQRRVLAGTASAAAHLAVIAALAWLQFAPNAPEPESTPSTMLVSLDPRPEPPGPPNAAAGGLPEIAPPPVPQVSAPVPVIAALPASDTSDLLSDSQLAGATRAGEGGGGGGGGCDTARAVQQVLRRDPRVAAAVAGAGRRGKATMLWNGDWVRSGEQEGKGLAAVRQAIIWEVAFAPEACRNAPMHGLVLLSLADGGTRFAIGAGAWRWSDLLELRKAVR